MMEQAGPITEHWWYWLGIIVLALAIFTLVIAAIRNRWLRLSAQVITSAVVACAGARMLLLQDWLLTFGSLQANAWQAALVLLALHALGLFVLALVATTKMRRRITPRRTSEAAP